MSREEIAKTKFQLLVAVFVLLSFSAASLADSANSDATELTSGPRSDVLLGGDPTTSPTINPTTGDKLGFGVIARYYLNNGWFTGAALDTYEYGYEDAADLPADNLNTEWSDADALASNTVISGFVGRLYSEADGRFDWYWSAGVGLGFAEIDGFGYIGESMLAMSFEADTDVHLVGSIGTSYRFTPTWSATFAAKLEHHFMDVTATRSGLSNSMDSQSPLGAYISIDYRF
jgi:hypothetical protein